MWIKTSLFLIIINIYQLCFAVIPITPEEVLTPHEIQDIHNEKNYFLYRDMDETSPIWRGKNRKYGNHFLKDRTCFFDLPGVLRHVLYYGFPVQYKLGQLYRAKLSVHSSIGNLVPQIDIAFGEGISGIDIGRVFSGLFGFLLPSNWMKVSNQARVYKVSKILLERAALDEILKAKLMYINQHQLIQEFEIMNYYFIHLQILIKMYSEENRAINTMLGKFAFEGTKMASQRGKTRLGFNDLAFIMSLKKMNGDHTANTINIEDIEDFPSVVKEFKDLEEQYRDKETFLEHVVERSIELKAVHELYKISKLNISITATGSMFSYVDRPENIHNDARFAFQFGYGTLPKVLIAKSFSNTAKIDVQKEYLGMIDMARRSFDYYANSLGGYTEAKRSLRINRKAFKQNLDYLVSTQEDPDALFILSLNQLIGSEIKLNNALHGSLRARAYMDRFLLIEGDETLQHLPRKELVLKLFNGVMEKHSNKESKEHEIDKIFSQVKKSSTLKTILFNHKKHSRLKNFSHSEIKKAFIRNMENLLYSKMTFYKTRDFYHVIHDYIDKNNIQITPSEKFLLRKKANSFWKRI